jgi:hypothetical protein
MTILGFLTWAAGPFDFATADVLPTTGTRLALLAIELPRAITPTIAGLSVGAFVGVVGFIAVFLLVGRGDRRPRRVGPQRVFIAPYGTMPRDTPLPPQAFASSAYMPVAAHAAPSDVASSGGPGHTQAMFFPSSELSARAFGGLRGRDASEHDAPEVDSDQLIVDAEPSEPALARVGSFGLAPVASVAAAPHPLGIIKAGAAAMQPSPAGARSPDAMPGASIDELAFDDSPTEIGETYFDEPPQPRRRSEPPRIRPIATSAPRFRESTPPLPRVTPPPMRAVQASRG